MKLKTFFDFCSGIGGGRLGLEAAGLIPVGYADTSHLSVKTYKLLFNTEDEKNFGNIRKIDSAKLPDFDVMIAGFPCQSFSVIGRQKGFHDLRGQLIFDLAEILKIKKPKCFIFENVRGLVSHNKGETLKTILNLLSNSGYDVVYNVLNSIDYGVPQMRQRVYFIGVRNDLGIEINNYQWPIKKEKPSIYNYLLMLRPSNESETDFFPYYLQNEKNRGKFTFKELLNIEGAVLDTRMPDLRIYNEKVPTLRSHRDGLFYVQNGRIYTLSGLEALLLQGFPKEYVNKLHGLVSERHLLMQAGNAMTVPVITELGKNLIKLLNRK